MIIPLNIKHFQHSDKYFVNIDTGKILSVRKNGSLKELYEDIFRGGYRKVKLYNSNGVSRMFWVHRLVIESWLSFTLPEEILKNLDMRKYTVDHIDFQGHNNKISNLRLMSRFLNNGRKRNPLTYNKKIHCFEKYFRDVVSIRNISKELHVSEEVISRCLKSKMANDWCEENDVEFFTRNKSTINKTTSDDILKNIPKHEREFIKKLYSENMTVKDISRKLGRSRVIVHMICHEED